MTVEHREIQMEVLLSELNDMGQVKESGYRTEFLRQRLEIVQMSIEQSESQMSQQLVSLIERDSLWMHDAVCCLND